MAKEEVTTGADGTVDACERHMKGGEGALELANVHCSPSPAEQCAIDVYHQVRCLFLL